MGRRLIAGGTVPAKVYRAGPQHTVFPAASRLEEGRSRSDVRRDMTQSPWWSPHGHADRRPLLVQRNRLKTALRAYFEGKGFTEVECAALAVSPGNEAHLHAFATERITTAGERSRLYLHTSPEFAAKKLLAAGETRIFDFSRVFRNRERGPLHAPEFTMLEWYRAREPYVAVQEDCLPVLRLAAESVWAKQIVFPERRCDPFPDVERLTVAQAFPL